MLSALENVEMNKELKVTSLTIQLKSGQKIELSLEEAQDLYEHFDELFGKKTQVVYPTYIPTTPWIVPYYKRDTPYYWTMDDSTTDCHVEMSTGTSITYHGELFQQ